MTLAVSTYASGRTAFGAVNQIRAAIADRRLPDALSQEDTPASIPQRASGSRALTITAPIPGDPEATIEKLETLRDTALAPLPRSAEELALAQLAHTRMIQADAMLRAQEQLARIDARQARQLFERDQAQAAYAQLASGAATQSAEQSVRL